MRCFATLFLALLLLENCECGLASSKCEEYARAVYVQTDSPILARKPKSDVVSNCGIVSVPLIIGGTEAAIKEFPHMAVIGFGMSPKAELSWDCGGSLISEVYVLTAAHCLESRELGPSQIIRLGTIHLNSLDSDFQERLVSERIFHPEYKPLSKANDIALIRMENAVNFTPYVRPACLNTEEVSSGRQGIASGFGKIAYEAESGSKKLMKVLLDVYSNDECSKIMPVKETMQDSMLCAGQMAGGKDTCQGDSGGPFQIVLEKPYCMYSIVGITSFGKFCGYANSPAVYTKVSSYVPWIEKVVWP